MSERIVLRGGTVLSGGRAERADVWVADGQVVAVGPGLSADGAEVRDVGGAFVAPGFLDLQLNGAFGVDLTTEPHRVGEVAAGLPRFGVTGFCPTVISCSGARRQAALDAIGSHQPPGARNLGLHLEGPFLSPVRRGAHPLGALAEPSVPAVHGWRPDQGVALATLAPELPGALDVVAALAGRGVVVSAGHSDATAEQFTAAVDAGVRYVTHLFNGMRPFGHRDPGVIGAALTDDRVTCGLIVDGIHVDPVAVRMAWRLLGSGRTSLVSDAVAVLGVAGGRARVGDVELRVTASGVREPGGALAGTDLSLDAAVRNLVRITGCSPAEAVLTVTEVPARLLGRPDLGRVAPGAVADLVVLDDRLGVLTTYLGGRDANMTS